MVRFYDVPGKFSDKISANLLKTFTGYDIIHIN